MKYNTFVFLILSVIICSFFPATGAMGQVDDKKPNKKGKADKEAEQRLSLSKTDSLILTQQFVFKADFSSGSDEVFVEVDSSYAMVQNGNRNNLEGQVTSCKVKRDDKHKSISVTLMMRGAMSTADVFLFIGPSGRGKATIKSDFPGYFSFDGFLVDPKHADIYEGGSHFVH